jgi:methylthioribulose-1-phosphate dehydratase
VVERFDPADKPSAETSIHRAIYEQVPDVRAVYHVHSVEASIVSHMALGAGAELPPLEMLKGFGIWDDEPQVILPVFDNHADVPRIADEVRARFAAEPPRVPALLIRGHGATVWAGSTISALHYVELLEFVFRYMVTARLVGL